MRITRQLLLDTMENCNKEYLEDKGLMLLISSYTPGKRTLYQVSVSTIAGYHLRGTDYIYIKEAYYYIAGIMNFIHAKELRDDGI
jgi:hypothetical protein